MSVQLINVNAKGGKKFLRQLNEMKIDLNMKPITSENMRQTKSLKDEDLEKYPFLNTILNHIGKDKQLNKFLNSLKLKQVFIGDFGRKAGYDHRPTEQAYFRFVIHFGSPEVYYKNERNPIPLLDGHCLLISPHESTSTTLTVFSNHINQHQTHVPKIRPKDYRRTTLIYDFEYNFAQDEGEL